MKLRNLFSMPRWSVMATAMIAVVAAAIIAGLIHYADRSHNMEVLLTQVEERSQHMSSLEWEAMADAAMNGRINPEIPSRIEDHNSQIEADLAQLDTSADDALGLVAANYAAYISAVRQEMGLLQQDRLSEARQLEDQQVAPGYRSLEAAVANANGQFALQGQNATFFAYIGSAVTALLAAAIVGLLFTRYDRQRIATEVAETQRRILAASEEHFRSLVQNSSDVIMVIGPDRLISYASSSARRVLCLDPDELVGKDFDDLLPPGELPRFDEFIADCISNPGKAIPLELRFRFGDGRWGHLEVIGNNKLSDGEVNGIVLNCRDISARKRTEEVLRSMSLIDQLTGLYNRRGFDRLSEQQLRYSHRTHAGNQLLFIDVDNLKWINDHLGHGAGDRALMRLSGVLRQTFRESDIVARYGGDEFVVLAVDTEGPKVQALMERLYENINRINAANEDFKLSISTGMSSCEPDEECDIGQMLASADALMYQQKREKKNADGGSA